MSRLGARLRVVATLLMLTTASAILTPAAVAASASSVPACLNDFGSKTPVLLVHGFHEGPDVWGSMTKAIQAAIPEVAVVTPFDYPNTKWVTDASLGLKLASVIRCLATDSKNNGGAGKVIIVAHSMGGLIVRCAADRKCAGTNAVNQQQIGLVVTLGTPNTGSSLATAGNGISISGVIACEAIVALQTGFNLPCLDLGGWLFGANSPAAQAMAVGLDGKPSPKLSALQPLLSEIPLDAIAGQITITTSLFDLGPFHVNGPQFDLGDLVVSEASALDGAPPTSPAHPGTSTPHPGPGSGTVTIPCGTISVSNLVGPGPASVVPDVTCWHLAETTDSAWQARVLAAVSAAASALNPAPCTEVALASALKAANVQSVVTANWKLDDYACESGYAYVGIEPVLMGLPVVAILKQQGVTWKLIYGPTEDNCVTGSCPGFQLPLPSSVLSWLLNHTVPAAIPEFYVHNGYELGSLYGYPNYPATIGLNNVDYLSGLQWTQVSQSSATATGTLNINNCTPDCASGTEVQSSIRLQASDPQQCTIAVYAPSSDVSEQTQAEVFNQLQVTAVSGTLPSWLVGPSPTVLPAACG